MLHRFNLIGENHHSPQNTFFFDSKSQIEKLMANASRCLPIWLLMVSMLLSKNQRNADSHLQDWSRLEFFQQIRERSIDFADRDPEIAELRLNFLSNTKIKNENLMNEFREAGLSHLLALSGGQTGPAATVICHTLVVVVCLLLRGLFPRLNARCFLNALRLFSLLVQSTILLFLVGLYQSTGALTRSLASQMTRGALALSVLKSSGDSKGVKWLSTFSICSPWLLSWLWHQNPAYELSFILSLMGGLTASLQFHLVSRLIEFKKPEQKKNSILETKLHYILNHRLVGCCLHWTMTTAMTSAAMTFMTLPLWPAGHLPDKIFANLLAGPCVLFIVTPASLAVCLGVLIESNSWTLLSQKFLSFGLHLLREIARAFSTGPQFGELMNNNGPNLEVQMFVEFQPTLIMVAEIAVLYFCLEVVREKGRGAGPKGRVWQTQPTERRSPDSHPLERIS